MDTIERQDITMETSAGFPLPDGVWKVEREQSEIGFAVKEMWGARTVRGVFRSCDGSLRIRDGVAAGELTVATESVDTGNDRRDKHLRSPAFFDVDQHPQMRFAAKTVTAGDDGLTVAGDLELGASRVRIEIPVSVSRTEDGALRLEGTTTVSRTAVGLGWNVLGMIRGDAVVHAQLTLATV